VLLVISQTVRVLANHVQQTLFQELNRAAVILVGLDMSLIQVNPVVINVVPEIIPPMEHVMCALLVLILQDTELVLVFRVRAVME